MYNRVINKNMSFNNALLNLITSYKFFYDVKYHSMLYITCYVVSKVVTITEITDVENVTLLQHITVLYS